MPDDALIQDLLLKLLDEDGTPESICQNHPHVLTQVRSSWRELNRVRAEVEHLFPATATAPESPPPSDGPPAISGYEIVRLVGRGAMGTVYEAVHATLGKRVALKVLSSTDGDDRVQRFLREARIAAALHHTNIVPVFDFGTADGVPFYAMQFIEGRP